VEDIELPVEVFPWVSVRDSAAAGVNLCLLVAGDSYPSSSALCVTNNDDVMR